MLIPARRRFVFLPALNLLLAPSSAAPSVVSRMLPAASRSSASEQQPHLDQVRRISPAMISRVPRCAVGSAVRIVLVRLAAGTRIAREAGGTGPCPLSSRQLLEPHPLPLSIAMERGAAGQEVSPDAAAPSPLRWRGSG
jgi:hypothetical protein